MGDIINLHGSSSKEWMLEALDELRTRVESDEAESLVVTMTSRDGGPAQLQFMVGGDLNAVLGTLQAATFHLLAEAYGGIEGPGDVS